jgi:hypothetical protein
MRMDQDAMELHVRLDVNQDTLALAIVVQNVVGVVDWDGIGRVN